MSQATLKTVTLETLATAVKAAEQAVDAYRAGGRRLLATLDERVAQRTAARTERYAPKLAAALRRSSTRANTWALKRIDAVGQRTDALITAGSAQVAAQVRRLARVADGVQNPMVAKGLDAAARATLPGAKAALALTERVAAAAEKLPGAPKKAARRSATPKVAPTAAPKAAAKPAAQPAATRRAAAKPARALKPATELVTARAAKVRRAVKKAADETAVAAKPAVRAARKSVRAAVKPAVEAVQPAQAAV